jgi:chemotaxis family two-component system response regulator Rcp1
MTPESGRTSEAPRQLDILIVENDPAMARLMKEAFKEAGLRDGVRTVPNGDEAIAYLRRQEQHRDHPHPDIIFLDLHLPRRSGLEVLEIIKADPKLAATPVVIVSGSEDPQEVREAYELHASCYVRKPTDLNQFLYFIRTCYEFWGTVVTLPSNSDLVQSAP